jgi:hypothetical protein
VAVSKIAAMFASLVPPPSAADAPQPALLRHNDLRYLSGHLLLLPFLHAPALEALVGGEVWFGDDALRLRAQARALANASVGGEAGCWVGGFVGGWGGFGTGGACWVFALPSPRRWDGRVCGWVRSWWHTVGLSHCFEAAVAKPWLLCVYVLGWSPAKKAAPCEAPRAGAKR